MIDLVQRASSRSAGILSVIAQSLGFAGPLAALPVRDSGFRGVAAGRQRALAHDVLVRQTSGDWYERLA